MTFLEVQQWEKQFLQIIYKSHSVLSYFFISKETSDLPVLALFSDFHVPVEAWQLKLHRHFPDGAFLHIKQQLTNSRESSAPTPHQHKTWKGRFQTGSCPHWRHSMMCILSIHSQYWHEPLTSAELVLAGKVWVAGNWFKRSIHFQDSWIIFKIHFHKLLKEK